MHLPSFSLIDFKFFLARSTGSKATSTASEKIDFTPSRLLAEHSKYPAALMDLANFRASPSFIKFPPIWRRSLWVPTRRIGMLGACFRSSGTHLSRTFSNDVLEAIEKQTTKTFEFA